jgi:hypothetical protein
LPPLAFAERTRRCIEAQSSAVVVVLATLPSLAAPARTM